MASGRVMAFSTGAVFVCRQMTNQSGAITYAQAYDPYGVVTLVGGATRQGSAYGFAPRNIHHHLDLTQIR